MDPKIIADLHKFYPEIVITGTLLLAVVADIALPRLRKSVPFVLTVAGLTAALVLTLRLVIEPPRSLFYDMVALDPMAVFFKDPIDRKPFGIRLERLR